MDIKPLLASALLSTTACLAAPPATFALIKLDGNGHALLITAKALDPTTAIHLQFPSPALQPQCCKRLPASDFQLSTDDLIATNQITDTKPLIYKATIPADWADLPFIGIAAFGDVVSAQSQGTSLRATTSKGKRPSADLCVSTEGAHLTQSQGGKLTTHLYLGLEYEVESVSCQ